MRAAGGGGAPADAPGGGGGGGQPLRNDRPSHHNYVSKTVSGSRIL